VAVEGRLGEPSLAAPVLSFAVQKAFAEEAQFLTEVPAFHEISVVLYQYVLGVVGMVEQVDEPARKAQTNNIAVFPRASSQKAKRISRVIQQVTGQVMTLRAGRKRREHHREAPFVTFNRHFPLRNLVKDKVHTVP
jgi:hypothetical protein